MYAEEQKSLEHHLFVALLINLLVGHIYSCHALVLETSSPGQDFSSLLSFLSYNYHNRAILPYHLPKLPDEDPMVPYKLILAAKSAKPCVTSKFLIISECAKTTFYLECWSLKYTLLRIYTNCKNVLSQCLVAQTGGTLAFCSSQRRTLSIYCIFLKKHIHGQKPS